MEAIAPTLNPVVILDEVFNVSTLDRKSVRQHILHFEEFLDFIGGKAFEVEEHHNFSDGVYVRSVHLKKGDLLVGKIHKTEHSNILSKGDVSVLTEWGYERLTVENTPLIWKSQPWTKRVVYAHEDSFWTVIHPTNETDLAKIEDEVIAKNYGELELIEAQTTIELVEV